MEDCGYTGRIGYELFPANGTQDAVKAIIMLLTEGMSGQAYNIANEDSHMTIRQMAELVAKEIADNQIKVVIDIPEDNRSLGYAPGSKCGWMPQK